MKIMVGVNTLTQMDQLAYTNHCQFWYHLGKDFPNDTFCFSNPRRASIDRMRNQTVKVALENDFDYVLFIDDDVLIPPDTLRRLLDCKADIAAGWTIIRGYPYNNMFFKFDVDGKDVIYYNDFVLNEQGLINCDAVGFSCVLLNCKLLKKVPPPYFVTGMFNTEDVYFCIKAKKYVPEVTIVVDPNVKTAHILGSEVIEPANREAYKLFFETMYPEACPKRPLLTEGEANDRGTEYLKYVKETIDPDIIGATSRAFEGSINEMS